MSGTSTPIFPQTITNGSQTIIHSDGTTIKTLYTAGSNGSVIESIIVSTTDPASNIFSLYITISSVNYFLCSLPELDSESEPVNILTYTNGQFTNYGATFNFDANGNAYLYLANGSSLSIGVGHAVSSGYTVFAVTQGGDY